MGLGLDHAADVVSRHLRALRLERPVVVGPSPQRPGTFTRALLEALGTTAVVESAAVTSRAEGFRRAGGR